MIKKICSLAIIFTAYFGYSQEKYTVNGYIKDDANGEALIGATVYVKELSGGTVTNVYGFYALTLTPGTYSIEYSYIGFSTQVKTIEVSANQRIDIELGEEGVELEAVIVAAEAEDENVTNVEMSTAKLDIKTITKIPAFMGEVDVIKSIQLLPGVSSVGEGASGFNVRGGSVGQNLILLDEAPVYNSSHLLGFFSVFNPDAVKDVKLYKGGIPAQYGGRISSILDIRMKEGNIKDFEFNGGIGTVFSRFAVEGPIAKDKASFIVAGRRSYADVLARTFTDALEDGAALNFYDLTAKANYNINDKNRIYLSGYFGRDVFKFDENQGFSWGNSTATFRWNHLYNERLFSNLTVFFSDYDYELKFGDNDRDKFTWDSRIVTYNVKPEFNYFLNNSNELIFGGEALLYRFTPASAEVVSDGEVTDVSVDERKGVEASIYLGNRQTISSRLSMEYGLRVSHWNYLGDGNVYTFNDTTAGFRREVIDVRGTDNWESIQTYANLEPRFSFKYQTDPTTSIKGSYNRMAQYIHLISNTTASNPLDVWTPSSNNIKPQIGEQWALGLFKNFSGNMFETSVEVYYKRNQNQIDYIDGADLLLNEFLEGDLLVGDGRAYGAEFYVKKNKGKLTGWVSYTLSRSELQVDGINNGEWYPTRFDQTHNLTFAGFYDLSERWSLSANFTWISGTPTTFPTDRFIQQGYVIPRIDDNARNNVRIPDYHRLDISATRYGKKFKKNGKPRKVEDFMVFTIYNLYSRKNPFSIYFAQEDGRPPEGQNITTEARQVSIIGSFFPSISYNLKF
ncbi:MAG: TonB-dependent receptor [Cyclobacteriaceae bacterium]|nr:TonB-dependent receptor [Cyclobacteriaceae bacterium HetDA_MAG_MS6]